MMANAFMMSTIGWSSHLFFTVMLLVVMVIFMATKLTRNFKGHKKEVEELREAVRARDRRIRELGAQLGDVVMN
eukprot:CAMPEP_0195093614 /NCGR_PEP_ID=MMETSP0448-20130528/41929_1 /TAXON_ID=66468 /ORGANISM="Heterocapsa triquestra, Strain CCMP 448" /LENGTH=73 /DNA_ID=CAMNT_0040127555 /DNA_START=72 /DNA_END=293 /DNA_ORIENTATION=+